MAMAHFVHSSDDGDHDDNGDYDDNGDHEGDGDDDDDDDGDDDVDGVDSTVSVFPNRNRWRLEDDGSSHLEWEGFGV